jgi:hypothetical protein
MIVKSQILKLPGSFTTEKGNVIKEAVVAYEEYGNKEDRQYLSPMED